MNLLILSDILIKSSKLITKYIKDYETIHYYDQFYGFPNIKLMDTKIKNLLIIENIQEIKFDDELFINLMNLLYQSGNMNLDIIISCNNLFMSITMRLFKYITKIILFNSSNKYYIRRVKELIDISYDLDNLKDDSYLTIDKQ